MPGPNKLPIGNSMAINYRRQIVNRKIKCADKQAKIEKTRMNRHRASSIKLGILSSIQCLRLYFGLVVFAFHSLKLIDQ